MGQRRRARKRRKDAEVSPLQLYFDFFSPIDSNADVTPPKPKAERLRQSLKPYDEIDLMSMIYDLKKSSLPEDKPLLEAAQAELMHRRASSSTPALSPEVMYHCGQACRASRSEQLA
jgi:hypothetical protein